MEEWKDIIGYEKYYQISNFGNVKNIQTNKILVGDVNSSGYKRVVLYKPIKKRFFIHRLVAIHFCDGYQENLVVNHKDGNKQNNCFNNLEWVTHSENDLHAFKMNLRKVYPSNFKHGVIAYDKNTKLPVKEYNNVQECCEDLHVARSNVYNCCNGKQLSCKGYILKYKKVDD